MEDALTFFFVMLSIGGVGAGTYAIVALVSAWTRRLERGTRGSNPALEGEVEQLRERVLELEGTEVRLAELEERLDFAERMLAQARAARLEAGEEA